LAEESTLDEELNFLQQNNYFSRMGLITCLTLITNYEVKRVIRGQKLGSLRHPTHNIYLVRKGEL
jgi:hypothetical protein